MGSIGQQIKQYILQEFLPDVAEEELLGDTQLISTGILDSLSILNLRAWVEETFDVGLESYELDFDSFGTVDDIEALVLSKSDG